MRGLRAWALAGVAACAIAAPARAQLVAPPPPRQSVDANGVDLFLGTLNIASPKVSMGGNQGLSYYFFNNGAGWTDNVTAALDQSGSTATVRLGASTDDFTASGSTYTSKEGHGATLTLSGTTYTYTGTNGTVVHFTTSKSNSYPYYASLGRATDITDPSGKKLVYQYDSVYYCTKSKAGANGDICTLHGYAYRLNSITSSYGYRITLSYPETDPIDSNDPYWGGDNLGTWSTATGTALVNAENAASPSLSVNMGYPGGSAVSFTDAASRTTTFREDSTGRVLGITRAGSASENVTIAYSGSRVASVTTAAGTWTYGAPSDAGGLRTVTVTDPSSQTTTYVFNIASQRMTSMTDALSHTSSWTYDASGRVLTATAPELNSVQYTYDARGNATTTTIHAKSGSGQPDISTTANYPTSCTNAVTCNQPTWTKDALGNETDYVYDPTHGGVTSVTAPAPTTGAVRPQVRTSYTAYTDYFGGTVYRATSTSTCRTTSSCTGAADETVTSTSYGTLAANNLLPMSTTTRAGDSSVSATTSVTYDVVGNVSSSTDPLGAASTFFYDSDRWRTMAVGPDPDGAGPLHNRAVRTNYNADGTVASVETGTANSDSSGFVSLQQAATSYDLAGRKVKSTVTAGGTTYAVTQYAYDPTNRATCVAIRMNAAAFGSLPASACTLGTTGSDGPDRITRTLYDQVGRPSSVTVAYGTTDAATEAAATYTVNGRTLTATDANNNVTGYTYDAYDRPKRVSYPSPTSPGTVNTSDYEELTYDTGSRVTNRRLRDGNGIVYTYDSLGRVTYKQRPDLQWWETDFSYGYDNAGRLVSAVNVGPNKTLTFGYDALGRLVSQQDNWYSNGNIASQYDAAGRRTRETWADGLYVTYQFDATGAMTAAYENGTIGLAFFGYDDLGRRVSLVRGNGVTTAYGYDPASRLTSLGEDLNGTAGDLTIGFGYNAAGQITSRTSSNDLYAWGGAVNVDRGYTANGLNQYTASGSVTPTYDAKGNLTAAGSDSYAYTGENQLAVLTPAVGTATGYPYDPLGRLFNETLPTNIAWSYDGNAMATELGGTTNVLQRRYVYGPGDDEPLVWYEGSGTTDKRWLVADERGSVIAVTNTIGDAIDVKAYDEYGIPSDTNATYAGRFGYTGQAWLPSLGMWYYKARVYSPTLGRFLQTDPIGYGDGMNWYNYTGSDPVNGTDPSGTMGEWEWSCFGACSGGSASSSGYWNTGSEGLGTPSQRQAYAAADQAAAISARVNAADTDHDGSISYGEAAAAGLDGVSGYNDSQNTVYVTGQPLSPQNTHEFTVPDDGSGDVIVTARNRIHDSTKWIAAGGQFYLNPHYVDPAPWLNLTNILELQVAALNAADLIEGYMIGAEIKIGTRGRIAPFGNRTGNQFGELPHYHWRGPGGIGRHRPWEVRPGDNSFWDRFF